MRRAKRTERAPGTDKKSYEWWGRREEILLIRCAGEMMKHHPLYNEACDAKSKNLPKQPLLVQGTRFVDVDAVHNLMKHRSKGSIKSKLRAMRRRARKEHDEEARGYFAFVV